MGKDGSKRAKRMGLGKPVDCLNCYVDNCQRWHRLRLWTSRAHRPRPLFMSGTCCRTCVVTVCSPNKHGVCERNMHSQKYLKDMSLEQLLRRAAALLFVLCCVGRQAREPAEPARATFQTASSTRSSVWPKLYVVHKCRTRAHAGCDCERALAANLTTNQSEVSVTDRPG